jgi:hypothetical protein
MKESQLNSDTLCPHCLHPNDLATAVFSNASPSPGDISICMNCQRINHFDQNLKIVALPAEKLMELMSNPNQWNSISQVIMTIKQVKKNK